MQQIKDDILSAGGNAVAEYEMKTKAIEHHNLIQVCTHAFLKRRCKSPLPKGSVVVVDECHQLYPHELRIIAGEAESCDGWPVFMTATPTEEMRHLNRFFERINGGKMKNLDGLKSDSCRIRIIGGCQLTERGRMQNLKDGTYADLTYSPSPIDAYILRGGDYVPIFCAEDACRTFKAAGVGFTPASCVSRQVGAACTSSIAQGCNVRWDDSSLFDGIIGISGGNIEAEMALQIMARSRHWRTEKDGYRTCTGEIEVYTDVSDKTVKEWVAAAKRAGCYEIELDGDFTSPMKPKPAATKDEIETIAKAHAAALVSNPDSIGDFARSSPVGSRTIPLALGDRKVAEKFVERFRNRSQADCEKMLTVCAYERAAKADLDIVRKWGALLEKRYAPGARSELIRMENRAAFSAREKECTSPGSAWQMWRGADFQGKCSILASRLFANFHGVLKGVLHGKRTKNAATVYGSRWDHAIVGISDDLKGPIVGGFWNVDLKAAHAHILYGKRIEYNVPSEKELESWMEKWGIEIEGYIETKDNHDVPDDFPRAWTVADVDRRFVKTVTNALLNRAGTYNSDFAALDGWMAMTGNCVEPSKVRWDGLRKIRDEGYAGGFCAKNCPPLLYVEQLAVRQLRYEIKDKLRDARLDRGYVEETYPEPLVCSDGLLFVKSKCGPVLQGGLDSMAGRVFDLIGGQGQVGWVWFEEPLRYDVEFVPYEGASLLDLSDDQMVFWASAAGDEAWEKFQREVRRVKKKAQNAVNNAKNNAKRPTTRAGRKAVGEG